MLENNALTPQEVADILKIAKNTVYELIKRGELNSYRVGKKVRVDMTDVEEYKNRTKSLKSSTGEAIPKNINSPLQGIVAFDNTQKNNNIVISGQDIMLDILSRYIQMHSNSLQALRSYIGSYNGLYAMYQGNVDLATTHLWDGDTGEYNIPYVRRMLPGIPTVIIHLTCRMQGFYVQSGNPKNITSWEDFKRNDISMINREKGSGTRVLLDEHLRKLGIPSTGIKGYDRESTSHLAIASTVARGGADLGIGNEKSALQVKGVEFIPLQLERYELVIKKEDYNKPHMQKIVQILRSEEFRLELEGIGGYDLKELGKIVAEV